jgi:NAD(P)-dependent dehydrogenase (short-subunit alcohol dehydrogenase family)
VDLHALFDVAGRSAVVTGAAGGIGFAIADILSDQGAHVTMLDYDDAKLDGAVLRLTGRRGAIRGVVCDVTDADNVRRAFDDAATAQDGIDIVFANAGIGAGLPGSLGLDGKPLRAGEIDAYDLEDWMHVLNVNLTGVFLTAREAARHMKRKGWGRLIITSSELAIKSSIQVGTPYMASKAAVSHLMRNLALELASHGITVNAIAPGTFETDISGGALRDPALRAQIGAAVPLGRVGQIDELKGLALFLASPASSYMTGAQLVVDGGSTLMWRGPTATAP